VRDGEVELGCCGVVLSRARSKSSECQAKEWTGQWWKKNIRFARLDSLRDTRDRQNKKRTE
jgi:hypothetical protein